MNKYHEILGISENATKQEITKAFYKLALIWHPDKKTPTGYTKEQQTEKFREIYAAYNALLPTATETAPSNSQRSSGRTPTFAEVRERINKLKKEFGEMREDLNKEEERLKAEEEATRAKANNNSYRSDYSSGSYQQPPYSNTHSPYSGENSRGGEKKPFLGQGDRISFLESKIKHLERRLPQTSSLEERQQIQSDIANLTNELNRLQGSTGSADTGEGSSQRHNPAFPSRGGQPWQQPWEQQPAWKQPREQQHGQWGEQQWEAQQEQPPERIKWCGYYYYRGNKY